MSAYVVNTVATNYFGKGSIQFLTEELKKHHLKKALIVTDEFLYTSGVTNRIVEVLGQAGVQSYIYTGVQPNPTTGIIEECVGVAKEVVPDFLVALGGGSAIDTCKAVGIMLTNGGRIQDYEGINKSTYKATPLVAVNTTAGTGSEVTTFYVITDEYTHSKMVMVDTNCTVWIAVNDADFMMSMPKSLTAATGMDALTHAIEAVLSKPATPFTDKDALWAIKMITQYLEKAVENGEDVEAREMMAYAQYAAGVAFSNAGLGMVHAMAHSLGGLYNLPHGVCNAVLLPYVLEFVGQDKKVQERFIAIHEAMGLKHTGARIPYCAMTEVIREIKRLSKKVGIPQKLGTLNVAQEAFVDLAKLAIKDTCMAASPIEVTEAQIIDVYKKAY